MIGPPLPCAAKPCLLSFGYRVDIFLSLRWYDFGSVVLLIEWKVIDPLSVAHRNVAFNKGVVGYSDVLIAFNLQFLRRVLGGRRNIRGRVLDGFRPGDFDGAAKQRQLV